MSIPSQFSNFSPALLGGNANRIFHWKSGGTVGSPYVNNVTGPLIYKLWGGSGDNNHDRTIKYLNGYWSDDDTNNNPISVTQQTSINQQYIEFVMAGPSTHTFVNPFYSGSGGGSTNTLSGGSSPEIKDIHMYKLSDTSVSYSFNWQNVNSAFVWVNNVMHTISLGGAGQSGHHSSTLTGLNDGDIITISNTDFKYIHRFVEWSKLTWGNNTSVVAQTFGEPGYEYRISNTIGENTPYTAYQNGNQFALTAAQTTTRKVTHQVWKHSTSPFHLSMHGSSFTTGSLAKHRNFW